MRAVRPVEAVLVVVLVVGAVALAGCPALGNVRQPRVAVEDVTLESLGVGFADVRVDLNVENPNVFALPLQSVDWTLSLTGHQVLERSNDLDTRIDAGEAARVSLPVRIHATEAAAALYQLARGRRDYEVRGTVRVTTPFGPLGVPFSREGTLR